MLTELSKKSVGVGNIAEKALKDEKVLRKLSEGILSKNDTIRYNSFEVLMLLSEKHPEVLYPKWDFFVDMHLTAV